MANLIEREISGRTYYYLDKNIKLGPGKWKKISLYLGRKKPTKKDLKAKEKELERKEKLALDLLYEERLENFRFCYISKKEAIEAERIKENFLKRFSMLSEKRKQAFHKKQVINFVYTTLRTEGVDVDFSDVETAYSLVEHKKKEFTFDDKVIISSSMITGFNYLPNLKVTAKDTLRLHGIIMSSYESKAPGQLRDDQRIIARFNPATQNAEEINYRPPAPNKLKKEFEHFFEWFDANKNTYPIELAALSHLMLYRTHPFKDGNKRVCRLIFNKILQNAQYPVLNISKETSAYFKALIKSVETGNDKYFVKFCYNAFIKQVKGRRLK